MFLGRVSFPLASSLVLDAGEDTRLVFGPVPPVVDWAVLTVKSKPWSCLRKSSCSKVLTWSPVIVPVPGGVSYL